MYKMNTKKAVMMRSPVWNLNHAFTIKIKNMVLLFNHNEHIHHWFVAILHIANGKQYATTQLLHFY